MYKSVVISIRRTFIRLVPLLLKRTNLERRMTLIKFRFCAMSLNEPFPLAKALSKSGNFGNKILTHFSFETYLQQSNGFQTDWTSYKWFQVSPFRSNNRSPGLVVMGDDSCERGRGFESMLDGHDIFSQ